MRRAPMTHRFTIAILSAAATPAFAACVNCTVYVPGSGPAGGPVVFGPGSVATPINAPTSAVPPMRTPPGGVPDIGGGTGVPGTESAVSPPAHTSVVSGEAEAAATTRRNVAAVQPHAEMPKPAECVAHDEAAQPAATADPLWQRMVEAVERRRIAAPAVVRRARPLVGDRGPSRTSDLGLGSPVRGPARDVFGAPSHVVLVPDTDALPAPARAYFERSVTR